MKLYLIGMPGSGKSTLGKRLAEKLNLEFIDLDQEIINHELKSIPEIFKQNGEDYFRQIESKLLHRHAASSSSFVMATGGGAPCKLNGIDVINNTGVSIFLNTSMETLLARLKSKTDRPLLSADIDEKQSTLRRLYDERLSCYSKAKIKVDDPTGDSLLKAIQYSL